MKGRPCKPVALKRLEGTYKPHRDDNKLEIKGKMSELPPVPSFLKGHGKIYYQQQGNELLAKGILNEFSLPLFVDICFYMTLKMDYAKQISGANTVEEHTTYRKLFDKAHELMKQSMQEFGLTAQSAAKIRIPQQENKQKSVLDQLLSI